MLSRRRFLGGMAGIAGLGAVGVARLLLAAGGGGGFVAELPWTIAGGASLDANLAATLASNLITVTTSSVTREQGYRPASIYNALWTRDHAYVIWHYPELLTASQRRAFVTYTLSRRTTGAEADPDGGTLPADFIADRIDPAGTATFKNAGASDLPFMDGIAFVVLALWSDWRLTGDLTTFTASQSAIDDCLAAIPRSVNGCVYSDPAHPSVDYGFTDGILKTGDVAYGTALQAWAYKMMAEMNGESGSGTYTTLRSAAESGLATLRQGSGWYKGSSGNNAAKDDVWATALIVAEELVTGTDRTDSAQAIIDAYSGGSTGTGGYSSSITQFGLVRHLPVGQYWVGTSETHDTYQDGGYWLTPLWDCVRAVDLIDSALARSWAAEAIVHIEDEAAFESGDYTKVPWEWHHYPGALGALGYSASAALVHRFV
jgi:hypothetical protein